MSIANNSLLRRILVEVRDAEIPAGLGPAECNEGAGQLLELRRTPHVHAPPFVTSLHFWAHALRAFLEDRGRADLFEALAVNCLCEAIAGERLEAALAGLAGRLSPTVELGDGGAFVCGYRMIEQEQLVSWVAERSQEFVALFWARPQWIATARPLDLS